MSLERDFLSTGVGIASTGSFGSLAVFNDTIVIYRIPFQGGAMYPPHDLAPPTGTSNPLPPGGTCGGTCLHLGKASGTFTLQAGDLARLQVNNERRLILVTAVADPGGPNDTVRVSYSTATSLLDYAAGLSGGLQLDRYSTFVQKLAPVVYWVQNGTLYRAERLNADGTLAGDVMAEGVQSWDVKLTFTDGDVLDGANATDSDPTNDYDDILGVQINARLAADRTDRRVNNGALYTRDYQWRFAPRNLMYERNRN
jgi:hypothetical protein